MQRVLAFHTYYLLTTNELLSTSHRLTGRFVVAHRNIGENLGIHSLPGQRQTDSDTMAGLTFA